MARIAACTADKTTDVDHTSSAELVRRGAWQVDVRSAARSGNNHPGVARICYLLGHSRRDFIAAGADCWTNPGCDPKRIHGHSPDSLCDNTRKESAPAGVHRCNATPPPEQDGHAVGGGNGQG